MQMIARGGRAAGRPTGQSRHMGIVNPEQASPRRIMQRMITLYEQVHRQPRGIPATYEVVCAVATKPD